MIDDVPRKEDLPFEGQLVFAKATTNGMRCDEII